jgi:hypothetical protein
MSGKAIDFGILIERVVDLDCSSTVSTTPTKLATKMQTDTYGPLT